MHRGRANATSADERDAHCAVLESVRFCQWMLNVNLLHGSESLKKMQKITKV